MAVAAPTAMAVATATAVATAAAAAVAAVAVAVATATAAAVAAGAAAAAVAATAAAAVLGSDRQRLQPWLFGEPPLNRVRGTPLHPDAMGCLCCRHKPTDYDKLLEPNPERPIYDAQGHALDKMTRRRLQRTYSSEFTGTGAADGHHS